MQKNAARRPALFLVIYKNKVWLGQKMVKMTKQTNKCLTLLEHWIPPLVASAASEHRPPWTDIFP